MRGSPTLIACALGWLAVAFAGCVGPEPAVPTPPAPQFTPGERAPADGRDWVLLTSGEWLAGELLGHREDTVRFDSETLDEVELDWEDVVELHVRQRVSLLLQEDATRAGTLVVRGAHVEVQGEEGGTFQRQDLLAVVPVGERDTGLWSGEFNFYLTAASGNTQRVDTSGYGRLTRESARTRGDLVYNGTFSRAEGIETSDQTRLDGRFDVFVSERLFVTPISVAYFRDPFQNIEWRVTPAVGLGYELFDRDGFEWEVSAGAGWRSTRFDAVPAGESSFRRTVAATFGTRLDYDLVDDVTIGLDYQNWISIEDISDYSHQLRLALSVEVWGDFNLDVSGVWNRTSELIAPPGQDAPASDDYRIMIGFGYSF